MIKRRPHVIWAWVWRFVTPTLLVFAAAFTFAKLQPLTYGQGDEQYVYPLGVTLIGVYVYYGIPDFSYSGVYGLLFYSVLTCITLGPTFFYILYKLIDAYKTYQGNATGYK